MKTQRTLLVNLLRIFGYITIPLLFLLEIDLIMFPFTDDFCISKAIYYFSDPLFVYMMFTWFAALAWFLVVLVLICIPRFRYVVKDYVIKRFFWIAAIFLCLLSVVAVCDYLIFK